MDKPLISILIPCYNGEKFINQCLNSVVNQTYKNIEILIMNDGSTDNTVSMLYEWKEKDHRIKIFSHSNVGVSQTRNELLKVFGGDYFSWLDIDDTFEIKSIETLYKNSYNGKADIVVGRTNGVYNDGNLKLPYFPLWRRKKKMTNLQYVKSNICTPWSSIIRSDFFKKLDVEFFPGRVFEDIGLMPYVYLKANIFVAINDTTYNYHKYDVKYGNITNFKDKAFLKRNDLLVITDSLFRKLNLEGWNRNREYRIAINGIFFEILILNNILINSFTTDYKIRRLLKYNAYNLLKSFGWKLMFSKTPWKTLGYIYIRISYIKFFKNGIIFKKTFQANLIPFIPQKQTFNSYSKSIKVYLYTSDIKEYKDLKNKIIEINEDDFIKNNSLINSSKLKYILIKVNNANFDNFTKYLDYQNINGITINSLIFEIKYFRENENFLIINIEYEYSDVFSKKNLINQLHQLNNLTRRPLIFLKCKWDKNLVRETKQLVDLFIFFDNEIIKVKHIDNTKLIDVKVSPS